jgi:uncharacterized protein involved in outer membrane biogenesis
MQDHRPDRRFARRATLFVRRRPRLAGALGGLVVLVLAAAIFLWTADWNRLRGPIARYASAQTHRHIEIDGDLKVHLLTWTPTVSIGGLKVGAPAWAGPQDTADIDRIIVSVRFWPLLTGRLVMPLVQLDRPRLNLLRDRQGRESWSLGSGKPSGKPFRLPPIERFVIDQGRISFTDETRRLRIDGVIDSNERAQGPAAHAFSLTGEGDLNKKPFALRASGGPLVNVRLDQPYPFSTDIRAGATHVTASGRLSKPFDFGAYDAHLHLTGADLADLYDLTGLALPNTPPYDLQADLSHTGRVYALQKAAGRFGGSDVEGGLKVVVSAQGRPDVTADIASRVLDFKDLATLFGAPPVGAALASAKPAAKAQASALKAQQRLLPDSTLATERLRGMDATVHYRAASVRSVFLPLRRASLELNLDHGVLAVDPVAFDFPQGRFYAQVQLDARGAVPVTTADMRLSDVSLQEFIPHAGANPPLEGVLAARAKLTGAGDSVHRAAAASNGAVTLVIPHGKIRAAFAELLGVNAGKGLGLLFSKSHQEADVRCAVANFNVKNGVLQAQNVIFDTSVVKVTGAGNVDLGPESIDLTLKGDTKRFRITHVFLPIVIGGHLRDPKLGVKATPAILQGGAALALGAVFPPALILPFVDPGLARNADCAALMSAAQTAPAAVKPSQAKGMSTPAR